VAVVDGMLVRAVHNGKKLTETPILAMDLPVMEAGKAKST